MPAAQISEFVDVLDAAVLSEGDGVGMPASAHHAGVCDYSDEFMRKETRWRVRGLREDLAARYNE